MIATDFIYFCCIYLISRKNYEVAVTYNNRKFIYKVNKLSQVKKWQNSYIFKLRIIERVKLVSATKKLQFGMF